MITTSNISARRLAELLAAHNVSRAVVSPGSRNAPLLQAVASHPQLSTELVTDERQAGFVALGMARASGDPVALVCTSGSAALEYMPAVSEAYYSRTPLIVITADRPAQWIGQDDSQTIVQPGVMSSIVKKSYNLPPVRSDEDEWFVCRQVNDALLTATSGAPGPVHINIIIDVPIGALTDIPDDTPQPAPLRLVAPQPWLAPEQIKELAQTVTSTPKVMIVCGFMPPDRKLNESIGKLSRLPNVAVLTETIANLHGPLLIPNIDGTLAAMRGVGSDDFEPQLVITVGGALVSRHLKEFLRALKSVRHWHVSTVDDTVDCFKHLSLRIATEPSAFFSQLAATISKCQQPVDSEYSRLWRRERDRAISLTQAYAARAPWSDFKAMSVIFQLIPRRWNVQMSNGTPIRYGQIFGYHELHRCDCNRGVSGIDGCTATAVGASVEYLHDVTLLISGDTSASYDIGSLTLSQITPRFKMIVVDNGGGGIFRFIKATSGMPVLDTHLACDQPVGSIMALAQSAGFAIYEASSEDELRARFGEMASDKDKPGLLVIHTPARESAEILKEYFQFCSTYTHE